jgi:hypothetical protein
VRHQSTATVSYDLTTRTSLGATAAWRTTEYEVGQSDLTHRVGSVRLSRRFTKYLALTAGYGYQEGRYSEPARTFTTDDIHVGVDYDRPLSRSRRTFVSFSSGSSVVEDQTGRSWRAVGSASLRRLLGRTWSAQAAYDRTARYVEGFSSPFLADAVSGTIGGWMSRRLDTTIGVGYSTGVLGFSSAAPGYETVYGTGEVRYAITQLVALTGQYQYYRYTFDASADVGPLPRELDRHGAHIGVSVWLPLLR